ncbi:MAG: hypothetical protein II520_04490, partial [Bacilli bacterium]|nr:hypothetical protein [Bacilli bacterium]
MKKKLIAWAVLPLAALLAACGGPKPTPTPSSPTDTSEDTSIHTSEETTSEETTSEDTSVDPVVEHLDPYTPISETAELRTYDARFDAPIDDFSSNTLQGATDGVRHNGFLRALVDSALPGFPKTTDDAVYKAAAGTYEAMDLGANGIGFKMRVSRGKVALKNLHLELRGDDAYQTYKIELTDALNGDGEALPELTDEFQDIVINPGQTIDDENTVYKNKDGSDSDQTVLGKIVGFHLVANDIEVGGEVEIDEVFTFAGTNRVVLDDFNHEDVAAVPGAWWGGSASGFIVRRGVTLDKGHQYTTPTLPATHTHVALSLIGDASGAVLTGIDAEGNNLASLSWTEADGKDSKLNMLSDSQYGNYIVDLGQLAGNGVLAKVKLSSTTPIELSNVFLTSMELPQLDLVYPTISPTVTLDNFVGDVASLDDNWDASAAKQVNIDAGRTGFVSYSMGDQINVKDGVLNLPATDGYASVAIGYQSTHIDPTAKYVVIAAKGDDLNLMRFRFRENDATPVVWFNAGFAAEGVKAYGDSKIPSPYVDENGFTHYVFDMEVNGLKRTDLLDLYYTGATGAQIESIYFATDDFAVNKAAEADPVNGTLVSLAGYTYVGGIAAAPTDVLGVRIAKAEDDADFHSFRVKMGTTALWLKDKAVSAFYADGRPVLPTDKIPEDGCDIFFDLSVFPEDVEHYVHCEIGLDDAVGSVQISKLLRMNRGYLHSFGGLTEKTIDKAYMWLGNVCVDAAYDFLMITLKATGTAMTYESFRLESP